VRPAAQRPAAPARWPLHGHLSPGNKRARLRWRSALALRLAAPARAAAAARHRRSRDPPRGLPAVDAPVEAPCTIRRVATGRSSETIGAAALPIDQTTRILGLRRAVPEMLRQLPDETRRLRHGVSGNPKSGVDQRSRLGKLSACGTSAARPER
jgi:hypothetical protein